MADEYSNTSGKAQYDYSIVFGTARYVGYLERLSNEISSRGVGLHSN